MTWLVGVLFWFYSCRQAERSVLELQLVEANEASAQKEMELARVTSINHSLSREVESLQHRLHTVSEQVCNPGQGTSKKVNKVWSTAQCELPASAMTPKSSRCLQKAEARKSFARLITQYALASFASPVSCKFCAALVFWPNLIIPSKVLGCRFTSWINCRCCIN